jgi:hypothetical protein
MRNVALRVRQRRQDVTSWANTDVVVTKGGDGGCQAHRETRLTINSRKHRLAHAGGQSRAPVDQMRGWYAQLRQSVRP